MYLPHRESPQVCYVSPALIYLSLRLLIILKNGAPPGFFIFNVTLILSSYSNYGGIPVKAEYCHEAVSLECSQTPCKNLTFYRLYDLSFTQFPHLPLGMGVIFSHFYAYL